MKIFFTFLLFTNIFICCEENSTNPSNSKVTVYVYDESRVLNARAWFNDTTRTSFMECTFVKDSTYSLIVKVFENNVDSTSLYSGATHTFSDPVLFEYKPNTYIGRINFKVSEITAWGYDSISIYPKEIKLLAQAFINYD